MSVLGEEDRELTLAHGVEALRYIGKELYVLRLVELRFGLDAILGLTPAEGLGRAALQKLYVDIAAVQLQTRLRQVSQIQLLHIDEDIVAVDLVAATRQGRNIMRVDEIEYGLEPRVERHVTLLVLQ